MSKRLTDQQYVQRQGLVCPFCQGHDLGPASGVTLETDVATQEIRCNSCKRTWEDIFTLSGYREVEETARPLSAGATSEPAPVLSV